MRLHLVRAIAIALPLAAVGACASILDIEGESVLDAADAARVARPDGASTGDGETTDRDGGGGGTESGTDGGSCSSCGNTQSCCAPRLCQSNVCCSTTGGSCGRSGSCCTALVCTTSKKCATTCNSLDGGCQKNEDCCFGTYCGGGSKCVACFPKEASCQEDFECCSTKCEANRCKDDD